MFSIIQRSTYFYSEFYVHILCEFSIVSNHDEMNYNIVSRVFFLMYSEVQILVIGNKHESDVSMNGSVKFVET
jgi:hypothetical protein